MKFNYACHSCKNCVIYRMMKTILTFVLFIILALQVNQWTERKDDTVTELITKVTATMYYPVREQCDSDPLITAGNYQINPRKASHHKWIAMSRDLLKRWGGEFDYGDKVEISGAGHKDGIYKITDTMNKRFKKRIDFLETVGTKYYKFKNVTIKKIERD